MLARKFINVIGPSRTPSNRASSERFTFFESKPRSGGSGKSFTSPSWSSETGTMLAAPTSDTAPVQYRRRRSFCAIARR